MADSQKTSRRSFLKQASYLSAAAITIPAAIQAELSRAPRTNDDEGKNFTFLFQGDSITDGNRSRNVDWNHVMGHGYACLIASRLWFDFPEKEYHFFNRGVSGNNIKDLTNRWQEDTIAIKPNVLSILIGVNDVLAAVSNNHDFTTLSYENDYRALLKQTTQRLPGITLVICEPFILPVGKVKDDWDKYQQEIIGRQQAAKKIAREFNAIYVPLQDTFNTALNRAPADYWIWDGVHPMPGGHELIAREWIKQVHKKLKFVKE